MPKGRPWTLEEEQVILGKSGKISIVEISTQIDRTPQAIKDHWREMKLQGRARGSLYCYTGKKICSSCCTPRHLMNGNICLICSKKAELERGIVRMMQAFDRLSPDQKIVYERHDKGRGSKVVPPPKKPNTTGMTRKGQRKAMLQHEKAVEAAQKSSRSSTSSNPSTPDKRKQNQA